MGYIDNFCRPVEKETSIDYTVFTNIDSIWGCTGFDARTASAMGKPKERMRLRWSRADGVGLSKDKASRSASGAVFSNIK